MKLNFASHAVLTENKIEWLKNNLKDKPIDTTFDGTAEHRDTDAIIDHWAKHDPSPKKTNTQWLINQYRKQNLRQEDGESVHASLSNFEKYKGKLEKKDINQYSHRSELDAAVHPHLGQAASRKEEKKGLGALIHDESGVKVFKVRNAEEATHFSKEACRATGVVGGHGGGTASYCTVAPNMFNNYMDPTRYGGIEKDPLYVIHTDHKDPLKTRYQFHFGSQQFADANDRNVGLAQAVKDHPQLRNVKDFSGKHPMLEQPEELNRKVAAGHHYPGYQSAIKMDHAGGTLTAETLEAASKHGKHLPDIAGHPNAHPDLIHRLAVQSPETHTEAAGNPSTRSDTLRHIVETSGKNDTIMGKVAEHPNTSPDIIGKIAENGNPNGSATKKAAAHPNLPHDTRERMIAKPEHHVNLLDNQTLSPEHVSRIAEVADAAPTGQVKQLTQEKLARHPKTSPEHLHKLAHVSDHLAVSAALQNPNLPHSTFESKLKNGNNAEHAAMAKSPHTPDHVLTALSSHALPFIAGTAAKTLAAKKKK